MRMFKQGCFAGAILLCSTAANAVDVTFLADDDDGTYSAQNSETRNIDCVAPATCSMTPGRHRLIGFEDEHSVWVTIEADGTVRYTYRNPRVYFPFANPSNSSAPTPTPTPAPTTPTPTPTPTPAPPPSLSQYTIQNTVVTQTCSSREPGRPASDFDNGPCTARCPDSYTVTGGNCAANSDPVRVFREDNNGVINQPSIRLPMLETATQNSYQCSFDSARGSGGRVQYGAQKFDFNDQTGSTVTATAICATIVSQ